MMLDDLLLFLEPIIQAKAAKATIPGLDKDDVAQELRIKVWKQFERFNSGKSSNYTFANIIFKNRITDLWKRNGVCIPCKSTGLINHETCSYCGGTGRKWLIVFVPDMSSIPVYAKGTNAFDFDILRSIIIWETENEQRQK